MAIAILIASIASLVGMIGGGVALGSQLRYPPGARFRMVGKSGEVIVDPKIGTMEATGLSVADVSACIDAALSEWNGYRGYDARAEASAICVYFVSPEEWLKVSPGPGVVGFLGKVHRGIGDGVSLVYILQTESVANKKSLVIHETLHAFATRAKVPSADNYGHQAEIWTRMESQAVARLNGR